MDYLVRLSQIHESFRVPELETLADRAGIKLEVLDYQPESPFCTIRLHSEDGSGNALDGAGLAKSFISKAILSRGIYELWGRGVAYEDLHEDVKLRRPSMWTQYQTVSFKFTFDTFCGKRSSEQQKEIIESFKYLEFAGKIELKNPEAEFVVFEEWEDGSKLTRDQEKAKEVDMAGQLGPRSPKRLFFGRYVGGSRRHLVEKHDLKKRPYISTTSMDAELALVTANLALAAPGKLFLDPFVGTGGFMVAASELGALTLGSDIDGRSYRGKGTGLETGVGANFQKYGLTSLFGDCLTGDLTNTPLRMQATYAPRHKRWLDGIISDPPYGIREGLKVLGTRHSRQLAVRQARRNGTLEPSTSLSPTEPLFIDGVLAHYRPDYIAPKKPYSFSRMLDNVLDFAARTLVDGGRLAFWMPSANELDQTLALPEHPSLKLKHVCVQVFNKWSRRLLIFERIPGDIDTGDVPDQPKNMDHGLTADDLNPFRKMFFKGFQND